MKNMKNIVEIVFQGGETMRPNTTCFIFCIALPSTCSVLKSNKPETPCGYYTIQPNKNKASFTVFCNITYKYGIAVTVFGHDKEEKMHVKGYEGKGAYSRVVTYNGVSMEQIENVVNASFRCVQFQRYDCKGAGFYFISSTAGPDSWWVSRQGYRMAYWGGTTPGSNSCACGMIGKCIDTARVYVIAKVWIVNGWKTAATWLTNNIFQ